MTPRDLKYTISLIPVIKQTVILIYSPYCKDTGGSDKRNEGISIAFHALIH